MQNVRPAAASFSRMIANLVTTMTTHEAGYWTTFMAGSAPVDVTVGNRGTHMYLYLEDASGVADVDSRATYLEAIGIVPNTDADEPEQWDVVGSRMFEGRRVALASFKGLDAAVGYALERVCALNWHAGAQDAHDPVAV